MFDAQTWYARDIILGRLALPSRGARDQDWAKWRAAEEAIEATDEANIRYQADYVRRLISMTDYPDFDIEGKPPPPLLLILILLHSAPHLTLSRAHKPCATRRTIMRDGGVVWFRRTDPRAGCSLSSRRGL